MVTPDPEEPDWPEDRFVRLGTQARGWVLLDTVQLGFEVWRQMNNFPPNFQTPAPQQGGNGSSSGN